MAAKGNQVIIVVIALFVGFGLAILPAYRHDAHLLHRPESNCPECEGER